MVFNNVEYINTQTFIALRLYTNYFRLFVRERKTYYVDILFRNSIESQRRPCRLVPGIKLCENKIKNVTHTFFKSPKIFVVCYLLFFFFHIFKLICMSPTSPIIVFFYRHTMLNICKLLYFLFDKIFYSRQEIKKLIV